MLRYLIHETELHIDSHLNMNTILNEKNLMHIIEGISPTPDFGLHSTDKMKEVVSHILENMKDPNYFIIYQSMYDREQSIIDAIIYGLYLFDKLQ